MIDSEKIKTFLTTTKIKLRPKQQKLVLDSPEWRERARKNVENTYKKMQKKMFFKFRKVWRKKQKNRGLLHDEFIRCPRVIFTYDREQAIDDLLERYKKKNEKANKLYYLSLAKKYLNIQTRPLEDILRDSLIKPKKKIRFKFRRPILPEITAKKPPLIPQIILPEDDDDKKLYQGLFKKKKLPIQFEVFS